jgi:hypothetical protein
MSWYRIAEPIQMAPRNLSVLDMVRGSENTMLTIGRAEFLLGPTQRIKSGPPTPIPDGLDHYKAYKIIDAADMQMSVEISTAERVDQREITRPIYLCVSTEEWHHEKHFSSTHPRDCFVVYQLDAQPRDEKVSTIDQFGLNQLRASKSQWICVRASLLKSAPD